MLLIVLVVSVFKQHLFLLQDEYHAYHHIYSQEQDELHAVIREWKDVLDEYEKQTGKYMQVI